MRNVTGESADKVFRLGVCESVQRGENQGEQCD